MAEYLPTGNFKWLCEEEIDELHLVDMTDDSHHGYI